MQTRPSFRANNRKPLNMPLYFISLYPLDCHAPLLQSSSAHLLPCPSTSDFYTRLLPRPSTSDFYARLLPRPSTSDRLLPRPSTSDVYTRFVDTPLHFRFLYPLQLISVPSGGHTYPLVQIRTPTPRKYYDLNFGTNHLP